jgi:hypothetical protein
MNCCICGPVRNCGPYLTKVFENIEKIGSLFDDYKIVIYYDKSNDNTLEILKEYQQRNPRLIFYVNMNIVSPFRTHRIAVARNYCLNYVRENKDKFPYFIMMDFDDVNCKNINVEPLKRSLKRSDWDGLSFNTNPHYYDIWALSIWPFCFSYNHFQNNFRYHSIIREYVMIKLKMLKPGQLLQCISSFNGFSIYRTNKFLNTYYDGRVDDAALVVDEGLRRQIDDYVYRILQSSENNYLTLSFTKFNKETWDLKNNEEKYDEKIRQHRFEGLVTQDDHLMHIVGIGKSPEGKTFFMVKNSWGAVGPLNGYINVSEAYFAINTISLVVPKAAISKSILGKCNIQP